MISKKALVVFSGGQDSTTCLFWAKKNFEEVTAVGFDYGQRHKVELVAAQEIARNANVQYEILSLPLLHQLTVNSLTRNEISVDSAASSGNLPNSFVDGRNLIFLSYAAVYAKGKNINYIVTGVGQADFSGYPDCRDVFIKSLNVTLNLSMSYDFVIQTPLMFRSKAQTWAVADELGVLDLVREKTVTCYNGVPSSGCGHCPACKLRAEGLAEYLRDNSK
jgi:7-cyano-7-deazaguanine synthase